MKRFLTLLIILAIFGAGFLLVKREEKIENFLSPYLKKVFKIEEKKEEPPIPPVLEKKIPPPTLAMPEEKKEEPSIPPVPEKKIPPPTLAIPVVEKPKAPVMEKIDTDGDGIPDTFVMGGEPGAASQRRPLKAGLVRVYCDYVVDGDTINVVLQDGSKRKVRLVGINTPEIKHGKRGRDEPGGQEAKEFVKDLCEGKTVYLDVDDERSTDKYGRMLAVVYVDQKNVNAELLRKGYANIFYIPPSEFDPYSW